MQSFEIEEKQNNPGRSAVILAAWKDLRDILFAHGPEAALRYDQHGGPKRKLCFFLAKIDYQNKAQAVPVKRSEVRIGLDFIGKRCMQVYSRVVGYDSVGLTAGEAKFGISWF